jgi:hypothetical protein
METNQIKEIKKELNLIKSNLEKSNFDIKIAENIDYSLLKIQRLLDPRPQDKPANFCSYCGKDFNNDISGFNRNNFLEM